MCIFNVNMRHVYKTKLLIARLTSTNKQQYQLVSYSNGVQLDPSVDNKNQAMILPVPCNAKDLIVIDSKDTWSERLVEEMRKAFDDLKPKKKGVSFGSDDELGITIGSTLKVQTAGSYQYSVAPSFNELTHYDPKVFKVSPEVCDYMKHFYATDDYCFLILKLQHEGEYHPFIYLHPMHSSNQLFIPTRHYHKQSKKKEFTGTEMIKDWDHDIYVINTAAANPKISLIKTNYINPISKPIVVEQTISGTSYPPAFNPIAWLRTICHNVSRYQEKISFEKPEGFSYNCIRIQIKKPCPNGDILVQNDTVHSAVWCDVCGAKDITGTRWACLNCDNYDICDRCHRDKKVNSKHKHNLDTCMVVEINTVAQAGELEDLRQCYKLKSTDKRKKSNNNNNNNIQPRVFDFDFGSTNNNNNSLDAPISLFEPPPRRLSEDFNESRLDRIEKMMESILSTPDLQNEVDRFMGNNSNNDKCDSCGTGGLFKEGELRYNKTTHKWLCLQCRGKLPVASKADFGQFLLDHMKSKR
jgi:hypothetical protein